MITTYMGTEDSEGDGKDRRGEIPLDVHVYKKEKIEGKIGLSG